MMIIMIMMIMIRIMIMIIVMIIIIVIIIIIIVIIIITTMALVPQGGQKRNFQLTAPSAQERRKGLSIIVVMVSQQTDCWNLRCKYNTIDTLQN